MSLISFVNANRGERLDDYAKKALAQQAYSELVHENPLTSQLNANIVRQFIEKVLEFSSKIGSDSHPCYKVCTGSAITIPFQGSSLQLTGSSDGRIMKVCPHCKLTADVPDPVCPNCNHVYANHEGEAELVSKAISHLTSHYFPNAKMEGAKRNGIVLQDDVEGFTVRESDVDKYLRDIEKYKPRKKR